MPDPHVTAPEPVFDGDDRHLLTDATVLIIDADEARGARMARRYASCGAHVDRTTSGETGSSHALEQPDVILIATELTDGSGLIVTDRLRQDPLTQRIPIIQLVTVEGDQPTIDAARAEALRAGADTVLVDPVAADVMLATTIALLRHAEVSRHLELALSLGATGVFDWNVPTGSVRWTESLERIYGLAPSAFGGTYDHFIATVHPDDRAPTATRLATALRHDESIELSFRFIRADGSIGWIESRGRVFRNRDGGPVRVLGLAVDVTPRVIERRGLEQLRRLAGALNTARTTGAVIEELEAELDGSPIHVALHRRDEPPTANITFSYLSGEHRLDLWVDQGESPTSPEQAVAIGEFAGGALDRAVRNEAERSNAEALQRALLPLDLPDRDSWSIDAEYTAAFADDRLGGDFYDVVAVGDTTVIVIGDVAGHGLRATRQMGAVRILLRTMIATHAGRPARVLHEARNAFDVVCGADSPFVTVCLIALEDDGSATVASAGHPPPLLGTAQEVSTIDVEPAPPLGVSHDLEPRERRVHLATDDWLALYTDGVFEHRGIPIDQSIAKVLRQIVGCPKPSDLIELADANGEPNSDDRAVVVVQRRRP